MMVQHPQVHKSPWRGQGAEAQPGEKQRDQGIPSTPPGQGGHLLKDEELVIGAVMGASWDAPGDPYKGLRGAGAFYSLCLGEEVRGCLIP